MDILIQLLVFLITMNYSNARDLNPRKQIEVCPGKDLDCDHLQ